jgi:O-antigen ligase
VLPYVGLVTVSVTWAVLGPYNDGAAIIANQWLTWLVPVIVALTLSLSPMKEESVRAATRTLLIVLLGSCLYAGCQLLVVLGLDEVVPAPIVDLTRYAWRDLTFGRVRLYGTLPNLGPNFFGAFLVGPTVLAFSRALSQRGLVRLGWLLAAMLAVAVIGATYSRGAMLGLLVALLVLPVWRRTVRGLPLLAVTLGVAVIGVGASPIGRHVLGLYASGEFDVSGSARLYLWRAILNSASEHPIGLGFGGWDRASMHDVDIGFADLPEAIGTSHPAENQWMRELADRGVLGVAALALLLGGLITTTFRSARTTRAGSYTHDFLSAAGATFVGWAFVFLTGDHLMYDSVAAMFWYFAAVAMAAARDAGTRSDDRPPSGLTPVAL